MSDSYITLVPNLVKEYESNNLATIVIDYLKQQNIIKSIKTDCTLAENLYPPGDNYNLAVEEHNHCIMPFSINGLEVITKRSVFHNGGNGLDAVICPVSEVNVIDDDWQQPLQEWFDHTDSDNLICNYCKSVNLVICYVFVPTWGFGSLGFKFWNWPPVRKKFVKDIEQICSREVKVIYGRI